MSKCSPNRFRCNACTNPSHSFSHILWNGCWLAVNIVFQGQCKVEVKSIERAGCTVRLLRSVHRFQNLSFWNSPIARKECAEQPSYRYHVFQRISPKRIYLPMNVQSITKIFRYTNLPVPDSWPLTTDILSLRIFNVFITTYSWNSCHLLLGYYIFCYLLFVKLISHKTLHIVVWKWHSMWIMNVC